MNLPCVQEHASGVPTGRAKAKKTSPGFPGAGLRELELALEHVVRCLLPIALAASLSCKTPIHRLDYESAKAFFCLVTDDPEGQEAWQLVAGETALDASDVAGFVYLSRDFLYEFWLQKLQAGSRAALEQLRSQSNLALPSLRLISNGLAGPFRVRNEATWTGGICE